MVFFLPDGYGPSKADKNGSTCAKTSSFQLLEPDCWSFGNFVGTRKCESPQFAISEYVVFICWKCSSICTKEFFLKFLERDH